MNRSSMKTVGLLVIPCFVSLVLVGCETKGPAQQAGENIDKAGQNLKNAVDPRGPAERAGNQLDKAVGNK